MDTYNTALNSMGFFLTGFIFGYFFAVSTSIINCVADKIRQWLH